MSPRAVSPWTWRHALRDHWPEHRNVLLTLYTISVSMDGDTGIAWPGQQLIADGARVSVKTVQRHIKLAKRIGWLGVTSKFSGGKSWRHYVYRAAIPDHLPLTRDELKVSDAITAEFGRIGGDDTLVSPRSNGSDTLVSPRSGNACTEGGDKRGVKVATNHHEGGDTGDAKVATRGCRTKSSLKVSSQKCASEEACIAQSHVARDTGSYTRDRARKLRSKHE